MSSKFMMGSPVLIGDNTVPGVKFPEELKKLVPTIFQKCRDFGLDFYPTVLQKLTYDEMSEICSYGGFPRRYRHWKFGMEYEEMQRGYEHGMHRVYEIVINTNPCYLYMMDSNTIVDDVTVIAHALGHNDFFKNNVFFQSTSQNMMNQLANNGVRINKYMTRWGKERVGEFIDHILRIQTLIDPIKAWDIKSVKNPIIKDERNYKQPERLNIKDGHEYMEEYINTPEWRQKQLKKINEKELAQEINAYQEPTRDIMGFLRDNADLNPWQADILAMLYGETMYFAPQRITKVINEGWASLIDYHIMAREGLVSLGQKEDSAGIIEYSAHKMGVLGGKYSNNPYKLGFCLFLDIEERWNKGQFGNEWDECKDFAERENWDKKLDLGREKIFDVRKYCNDFTFILEYFTPEFCDKYEFYTWKRYPNGEYKIETRNPKEIKKKLLQRHSNGGLPEIRLTDANHRGRGHLFLEHQFDGRALYEPYLKAVMESLHFFWGKDVFLSTHDKHGHELIYHCVGSGDKNITYYTRDDYIKSL